MEMRAGCRLPRSGLFPLNLNLNLGRRSRGLGRAEGGREGLGAGPPQAPGTHPGAGGDPWAPSGFCAVSRGELESREPEGFAFIEAECWKVPSQQCVCHPSFHGTSRHEVISCSKSPCMCCFIKGKK